MFLINYFKQKLSGEKNCIEELLPQENTMLRQIPQKTNIQIKEDVATSPIEATEQTNVITIQSENTMEQEKQSLAVELVGKLVSLFAPAKAEVEQEPEVVVEETPVEEVVEAPEVVTEEAEEVAPEVVVEAVEEPVQEEVEVVEEKVQAVAESPVASELSGTITITGAELALEQVSELQAQIAQLTAQLAVKEDLLVMASYIARAEKEFSHLSGTSEEIATRIKDIEQSTMSAETKELVLNALKAESAKNLADCQEVGTEMGATTDLSDEEKAELALRTAADALALKEGITPQQALYRLSSK